MRFVPVALLLLLSGSGVFAQEDRFGPTPSQTKANIDADFAAYWRKVLDEEMLVTKLGAYGTPALSYLWELLHRKVTISLREPILRHIPRISPDRGEEFLLATMKSKESSLRKQGLAVLAEVGTQASVDPLLKALDHPRGSIRTAAGRALAAIGQRNLIVAHTLGKRLRELLREAQRGNSSRGSGEAALDALVALEELKAVPDLVEAMENVGSLRVALGLLAKLDRADLLDEGLPLPQPSPEDGLLKLLEEPDKLMRNELGLVFQALRSWGSYDCVEPILEHLEREREESDEGKPAAHDEQALLTLETLTGEKRETLEAWNEWWEGVAPIWNEYEALLYQLEGDVDPSLKDVLDKLVRIRDPRTPTAVGELLERLAGPEMSKTELDVCTRACEVLAQLKDLRGSPGLIAVLDSDAPPSLKHTATWALSVITNRSGPQDPEHWTAVTEELAALPPARRNLSGVGPFRGSGSGIGGARVPIGKLPRAKKQKKEAKAAAVVERGPTRWPLFVGVGVILLLVALLVRPSSFRKGADPAVVYDWEADEENRRKLEAKPRARAGAKAWNKHLQKAANQKPATPMERRLNKILDKVDEQIEEADEKKEEEERRQAMRAKPSAWTQKLQRLKKGEKPTLQMHAVEDDFEEEEEEAAREELQAALTGSTARKGFNRLFLFFDNADDALAADPLEPEEEEEEPALSRISASSASRKFKRMFNTDWHRAADPDAAFNAPLSVDIDESKTAVSEAGEGQTVEVADSGTEVFEPKGSTVKIDGSDTAVFEPKGSTVKIDVEDDEAGDTVRVSAEPEPMAASDDELESLVSLVPQSTARKGFNRLMLEELMGDQKVAK